MTDADHALIKYMHQVTNDMEGVTYNLPPFARFEDEGMTYDDIATIIVHLEKYYYRHINLPYYPECLMDICDIVQGRPSTLTEIRRRAKLQESAFNTRPFIPIEKHGFWTAIKQKGRKLLNLSRIFPTKHDTKHKQ